MNPVALLLLEGIELSGRGHLLMMIPLCLSIAVVYKTTRCERLRDVPVAAAVLLITILMGLVAVGAGLLLMYRLMA